MTDILRRTNTVAKSVPLIRHGDNLARQEMVV